MLSSVTSAEGTCVEYEVIAVGSVPAVPDVPFLIASLYILSKSVLPFLPNPCLPAIGEKPGTPLATNPPKLILPTA